MRLSVIVGAAVLALSTAALSQVGSTPEDSKIPGNEAAAPDENNRAEATGNAAAPAPAPSPTGALARAPSAPVGQRPPK